ncbi:hypothetical protein L2E82_44304 [Cichorium intybus]|uniref:Uncharacterized protein n=1 Tax=Cichorium intybus TaxID=13427 RepID=A0ACB8ZQD6_CICIN|nr:hypothetical protein L2E82_44304 [Cichorium intybus]
MARLLMLDFQLDCIDYEPENWYHADLYFETFKLLQMLDYNVPGGSCYAFGVVDAVEGLYAIETKQLVELSPKEQPVTIALAVEEPFFMYKEGVLSAPCTTTGYHSVVAVGYDTAPDGTQYWIMKNSWSADWGEKGYVRVIRGVLISSLHLEALHL